MLEKISFLMKKEGLNKWQLAIKCGLSYSAVDGFFKVSFLNMKLQTFKALCTYFGVTMDSMAYDDREIEYVADLNIHYSADDAEHIRKYKAIDDASRLVIDSALNTAYMNTFRKGADISDVS